MNKKEKEQFWAVLSEGISMFDKGYGEYLYDEIETNQPENNSIEFATKMSMCLILNSIEESESIGFVQTKKIHNFQYKKMHKFIERWLDEKNIDFTKKFKSYSDYRMTILEIASDFTVKNL